MSRRHLSFLLVWLLGGVVTLSLLPFVPEVRHDLGPATVSANARLGSGATTLIAPPLGTVVATTHVPPLGLELALRSIDIETLEEELATGATSNDIVSEIEADLRSVATQLIVRLLLAGLIAGLLVAALLPRRRPGNFLAAALGGLSAMGVVVILTMSTFDETAFEEPRFTGALSRAPQVLNAVDEGFASLDSLGSRYETLAGRISEVLRLTTDPGLADSSEGTSILHVSDIHSNPVGIEIAKRLARAFDVDAIVDTGDLTSFGEPIESRLGRLLKDVDVPYYFVPGNHDSPANRESLDDLKNIDLVHEKVVEVDEVRILGWADPTFTADNELSTEEGNAIRESAAREVAEEVAATSPDVLAVHDARLASASIGNVPLVLAGHTHQRGFEQDEGTTTLTVGSTGATGLGSFVVESDLPYEAQVIYLDEGAPEAVDYIRFVGINGDFEVERQVIEES